MQRVGSRLEIDHGDAAAYAPELRIVGVGLDGKLLGGVDGGHEGDAAVAPGVGHAVENGLVFALASAADGDAVDVAERVELHRAPVGAGLDTPGRVYWS